MFNKIKQIVPKYAVIPLMFTVLGNMLDKEEKSDIDRYIKYGLEVAGIVLPMCFYSHWMKKGFEFEKTGTYCSTTFRGLFNKFNPKKM